MIVIGCPAGVALLVVGAVCYKWGFRAAKMRRSVDETLGLEDSSLTGADLEKQEALRLILDRQRS
jgi:hypothetical protein